MEIAGNICTVCGHKVVFAQDGKCCPACRTVVHETCDSRSICPRCGRPYERQETPIVDPLREAIVPRCLRPLAPASPVAMVICAALLFVVLFGAWMVFIWANW